MTPTLCTLLLTLSAPAAVLDYTPEFETEVRTLQDDEELPEREQLLKLGAGGVFGSGNARYLTLTGSLEGRLRVRRDQVTVNGQGQYAATQLDEDGDGTVANDDGPMVVASRTAQGNVRYDRFLSKDDSLYSLVGFLHSPFSGLDGRVNGRLGYSRALVTTEPFRLQAALGADLAREWYTEGVVAQTGVEGDTIVSGMVFQRVALKLSESTSLTQEAEALVNVQDIDDVRVNAKLALSQRINSLFSTQFAIDFRFDNQPPSPAFRKLDTVTTLQIVATVI